MTLLGFFCILINIIFVVIFVPDLIGPVSQKWGLAWLSMLIVKAPSWLCYSFAAGVWMYSTMDNVDGKQARRTGTSSPLGELFEYVITRTLFCTSLTMAAMELTLSTALWPVCSKLLLWEQARQGSELS